MEYKTPTLGIYTSFGIVDEALYGTNRKGVIFEDILTSHSTDDIMEFFEEKIRNVTSSRFVPTNMTWIIQVVDRNKGIIYNMILYSLVMHINI